MDSIRHIEALLTHHPADPACPLMAGERLLTGTPGVIDEAGQVWAWHGAWMQPGWINGIVIQDTEAQQPVTLARIYRWEGSSP